MNKITKILISFFLLNTINVFAEESVSESEYIEIKNKCYELYKDYTIEQGKEALIETCILSNGIIDENKEYDVEKTLEENTQTNIENKIYNNVYYVNDYYMSTKNKLLNIVKSKDLDPYENSAIKFIFQFNNPKNICENYYFNFEQYGRNMLLSETENMLYGTSCNVDKDYETCTYNELGEKICTIVSNACSINDELCIKNHECYKKAITNCELNISENQNQIEVEIKDEIVNIFNEASKLEESKDKLLAIVNFERDKESLDKDNLEIYIKKESEYIVAPEFSLLNRKDLVETLNIKLMDMSQQYGSDVDLTRKDNSDFANIKKELIEFMVGLGYRDIPHVLEDNVYSEPDFGKNSTVLFNNEHSMSSTGVQNYIKDEAGNRIFNFKNMSQEEIIKKLELRSNILIDYKKEVDKETINNRVTYFDLRANRGKIDGSRNKILFPGINNINKIKTTDGSSQLTFRNLYNLGFFEDGQKCEDDYCEITIRWITQGSGCGHLLLANTEPQTTDYISNGSPGWCGNPGYVSSKNHTWGSGTTNDGQIKQGYFKTVGKASTRLNYTLDDFGYLIPANLKDSYNDSLYTFQSMLLSDDNNITGYDKLYNIVLSMYKINNVIKMAKKGQLNKSMLTWRYDYNELSKKSNEELNLFFSEFKLLNNDYVSELRINAKNNSATRELFKFMTNGVDIYNMPKFKIKNRLLKYDLKVNKYYPVIFETPKKVIKWNEKGFNIKTIIVRTLVFNDNCKTGEIEKIYDEKKYCYSVKENIIGEKEYNFDNLMKYTKSKDFYYEYDKKLLNINNEIRLNLKNESEILNNEEVRKIIDCVNYDTKIKIQNDKYKEGYFVCMDNLNNTSNFEIIKKEILNDDQVVNPPSAHVVGNLMYKTVENEKIEECKESLNNDKEQTIIIKDIKDSFSNQYIRRMDLTKELKSKIKLYVTEDEKTTKIQTDYKNNLTNNLLNLFQDNILNKLNEDSYKEIYEKEIKEQISFGFPYAVDNNIRLYIPLNKINDELEFNKTFNFLNNKNKIEYDLNKYRINKQKELMVVDLTQPDLKYNLSLLNEFECNDNLENCVYDNIPNVCKNDNMKLEKKDNFFEYNLIKEDILELEEDSSVCNIYNDFKMKVDLVDNKIKIEYLLKEDKEFTEENKNMLSFMNCTNFIEEDVIDELTGTILNKKLICENKDKENIYATNKYLIYNVHNSKVKKEYIFSKDINLDQIEKINQQIIKNNYFTNEKINIKYKHDNIYKIKVNENDLNEKIENINYSYNELILEEIDSKKYINLTMYKNLIYDNNIKIRILRDKNKEIEFENYLSKKIIFEDDFIILEEYKLEITNDYKIKMIKIDDNMLLGNHTDFYNIIDNKIYEIDKEYEINLINEIESILIDINESKIYDNLEIKINSFGNKRYSEEYIKNDKYLLFDYHYSIEDLINNLKSNVSELEKLCAKLNNTDFTLIKEIEEYLDLYIDMVDYILDIGRGTNETMASISSNLGVLSDSVGFLNTSRIVEQWERKWDILKFKWKNDSEGDRETKYTWGGNNLNLNNFLKTTLDNKYAKLFENKIFEANNVKINYLGITPDIFPNQYIGYVPGETECMTNYLQIPPVKKCWIYKRSREELVSELIMSIFNHRSDFLKQINGLYDAKAIKDCTNSFQAGGYYEMLYKNININNLIEEEKNRNLNNKSLFFPQKENFTIEIETKINDSSKEYIIKQKGKIENKEKIDRYCVDMFNKFIPIENTIFSINNASVILGLEEDGFMKRNRLNGEFANFGDYKYLDYNSAPNIFQDESCVSFAEIQTYCVYKDSCELGENDKTGKIIDGIVECKSTNNKIKANVLNMEQCVNMDFDIIDILFRPKKIAERVEKDMESIFFQKRLGCDKNGSYLKQKDVDQKSISHVYNENNGEVFMFEAINLENMVTDKYTGIKRSLTSLQEIGENLYKVNGDSKLNFLQGTDIDKIIKSCVDFKSKSIYELPPQAMLLNVEDRKKYLVFPNSNTEFQYEYTKEDGTKIQRSVMYCDEIYDLEVENFYGNKQIFCEEQKIEMLQSYNKELSVEEINDKKNKMEKCYENLDQDFDTKIQNIANNIEKYINGDIIGLNDNTKNEIMASCEKFNNDLDKTPINNALSKYEKCLKNERMIKDIKLKKIQMLEDANALITQESKTTTRITEQGKILEELLNDHRNSNNFLVDTTVKQIPNFNTDVLIQRIRDSENKSYNMLHKTPEIKEEELQEEILKNWDHETNKTYSAIGTVLSAPLPGVGKMIGNVVKVAGELNTARNRPMNHETNVLNDYDKNDENLSYKLEDNKLIKPIETDTVKMQKEQGKKVIDLRLKMEQAAKDKKIIEEYTNKKISEKTQIEKIEDLKIIYKDQKILNADLDLESQLEDIRKHNKSLNNEIEMTTNLSKVNKEELNKIKDNLDSKNSYVEEKLSKTTKTKEADKLRNFNYEENSNKISSQYENILEEDILNKDNINNEYLNDYSLRMFGEE